jgi:hypothetical protein
MDTDTKVATIKNKLLGLLSLVEDNALTTDEGYAVLTQEIVALEETVVGLGAALVELKKQRDEAMTQLANIDEAIDNWDELSPTDTDVPEKLRGFAQSIAEDTFEQYQEEMYGVAFEVTHDEMHHNARAYFRELLYPGIQYDEFFSAPEHKEKKEEVDYLALHWQEIAMFDFEWDPGELDPKIVEAYRTLAQKMKERQSVQADQEFMARKARSMRLHGLEPGYAEYDEDEQIMMDMLEDDEDDEDEDE